jgi:hypothetical protein
VTVCIKSKYLEKLQETDGGIGNHRSDVVQRNCRVHGQRDNGCSLLKLIVSQIFRACHERRINDSGIDQGRPMDSKKYLSEAAGRRPVETGQNQTG